MRSRQFINVMLTVIIGISMCVAAEPQSSIPTRGAVPSAPQIRSSGYPSLFFEPNQGQTDSKVKFLSRGDGYSIFLTSSGMVLALKSSEVTSSAPSFTPLTFASKRSYAGRKLWRDALVQKSTGTVLNIALVGGSTNPEVIGEQPLATKVNYFIGRSRAMWRTNVPTYARVRYRNVYPGIDLVYYGNQGRVEYDFDLAPGADPTQIRFAVNGADSLKVDGLGNLVLAKGNTSLRFQAPLVYQTRNGVRVPLSGEYAPQGNKQVGFTVGSYDRQKPLIIDPVLVYSSYLGGTSDDFGEAITVDSGGNAFVAGITDSPDFPTAVLGSYPSTKFRMFLTKLDPTGSSLVFADYFGGTGGGDEASSLALDSTGNIYVAGTATSTDFPVLNPYQSTLSGTQDAFLTKFSSDGSSIIFSTYLGGTTSQSANSLAIDPSNQVVIAGSTSSSDFPTAAAYQSTVSADQFGDWGVYGFVTKFASDGASLIYSTYLAGNTLNATACTACFPDSEVMGVAIDGSGNTYVTGNTTTTNFPVTSGAYATTSPGYSLSNVGFVSKLSNSGGLIYSTFLGGQTSSFLNAIAVDSTGAAYVTGFDTANDGFPILNTAICDPSSANCNGTIIAKLDSAGANLQYSTYLAATNEMAGQAIAVDSLGNAFVLGSDTQFSLTKPIENYAGNGDVVIAEIDATATTQVMATFLGGQAPEAAAESLALDNSGAIYVTGWTQSADFPVTQGAFQTVFGGGSDAFVAKIDPNTSASAVALSPFFVDFGSILVNTPSSPQTVVLRNMGSAALNISSKTASGDFAETDDCGSSVPAASLCTFTITFTPTAVGPRSGTLTIVDDAQGSPHSASLSGLGTGASSSLALAPSSLVFSSSPVGSGSASQTLTVSNLGNSAVVINGIRMTGDFGSTGTNCGNLAPNATCTVQVSFVPTAAGPRTGSLQLTDVSGNSQTILLSGSGVDFVASAPDASAAVSAGGSASYELTVGSVGGVFSNPVSFSCSGAPLLASCTVTPNLLTPGAGSTSVTVMVSTTGTGLQSKNRASRAGILASWMFIPFGLFGILLMGRNNRTKLAQHGLTMLLMVSLLALGGCAGGTSTVQRASAIKATSAGTYTLTVKGTSGKAEHTTRLTLVVQ